MNFIKLTVTHRQTNFLLSHESSIGSSHATNRKELISRYWNQQGKCKEKTIAYSECNISLANHNLTFREKFGIQKIDT